MSNEFGYIPESPEQKFGQNQGIFTPKDIYDLTRADKYTNYGQLELIETQTVTSGTSVDFTSIKEDIYNVHFVTWDNLDNDDSSGTPSLHMRFYESGVLETASVYHYARQIGRDNGTFAEQKSTGNSAISVTLGIGNATNSKTGGYQYIYNAGDSSKYTFSTFHTYAPATTSDSGFTFGSAVLPQTSTVDGLSYTWLGADFTSGTISLYGIKEYS